MAAPGRCRAEAARHQPERLQPHLYREVWWSLSRLCRVPSVGIPSCAASTLARRGGAVNRQPDYGSAKRVGIVTKITAHRRPERNRGVVRQMGPVCGGASLGHNSPHRSDAGLRQLTAGSRRQTAHEAVIHVSRAQRSWKRISRQPVLPPAWVVAIRTVRTFGTVSNRVVSVWPSEVGPTKVCMPRNCPSVVQTQIS